MHRRSLICSLAALTACALSPATGWAQVRPAGYPTKPVTIIVPFTAGQSGDVLARVLGEPLSKLWGQTLVVDNRPGAHHTPTPPQRTTPQMNTHPPQPRRNRPHHKQRRVRPPAV